MTAINSNAVTGFAPPSAQTNAKAIRELERPIEAVGIGAFRMGAAAMRDAIEARLFSKTTFVHAGIAADTPLPDFPTPPEAKAPDWKWWSGPDDEYFTNGPFNTREGAIDELDGEGGHIVEALSHAITLNAGRLLNEQYFEAGDLFDYDHMEPDRKGGADAIAAADDELQALLDDWVCRWQHTFVAPNMFRATRNGEHVPGECVDCGQDCGDNCPADPNYVDEAAE